MLFGIGLGIVLDCESASHQDPLDYFVSHCFCIAYFVGGGVPISTDSDPGGDEILKSGQSVKLDLC